jgi:hypothetical protein
MALKALVLLVLLGTAAAAAAAKRLNVLMVAIDDLRTEISPYPEGAHMHTPAFQKLASESVVFERCYVQVAVCAASRTALLTSRWLAGHLQDMDDRGRPVLAIYSGQLHNLATALQRGRM